MKSTDLNSISCTSDDLVFMIHCDVRQCHAGLLKSGWNGGILFHDCNQSLSGYRSKWLGEGKGMSRHMVRKGAHMTIERHVHTTVGLPVPQKLTRWLSGQHQSRPVEGGR